MAKIAFILLCHKDPDAIIRQAESLTAVGDCMSIHFDARAKRQDYDRIREALKDNPNVTFARRRIKCGWGEWSLVEATLHAIEAAVEAEGASVKIIAPKIGGVTLKGGKAMAADGQLAGTPSVLFDAVVLVLSADGCAELLGESAAVDFVANAFVHLKAIGFTAEAQPLLDRAGVAPDAGIVDLGGGVAGFVAPARTRQWEREPKVRILA